MSTFLRTFLRLAALLVALTAHPFAFADDAVDFFRAVNVDDDRTVKTLLARGFDPNTTNPRGQPGLFVALRDESPKVAAALVAHPAIRVDATTAADETALMVAALRGNLEWTRRLLDLGAALNRPGWTALHYAASGPDLMVLKLLLERGAQIDALSPNRSTPLMMAAGYGPHESALWLLAGGASRLLRNDRDMSAADFAHSVGRDGLALQLEPPAR